uniref:Uncharacterized protein n=1 Tax=Arcella intermedia TaxID=1963864 RepID=A0A6B2L622_9EUKA
MIGELPSEIGYLVSLQKLILSQNPGLSGTLPTQLGHLENLAVLDVSSTSIEGSLPLHLNETSLSELDISNSLIRGTIPAQLGNLSLLRLGLRNVPLTGCIPSKWIDREWNIDNCDISGTNFNKNCTIESSSCVLSVSYQLDCTLKSDNEFNCITLNNVIISTANWEHVSALVKGIQISSNSTLTITNSTLYLYGSLDILKNSKLILVNTKIITNQNLSNEGIVLFQYTSQLVNSRISAGCVTGEGQVWVIFSSPFTMYSPIEMSCPPTPSRISPNSYPFPMDLVQYYPYLRRSTYFSYDYSLPNSFLKVFLIMNIDLSCLSILPQTDGNSFKITTSSSCTPPNIKVVLGSIIGVILFSCILLVIISLSISSIRKVVLPYRDDPPDLIHY